ncbi:MAG: YggT family protein [Candidatus Alcyoniella australis]|nr:YggT family protein [Candidatus Alcyoniella australis]
MIIRLLIALINLYVLVIVAQALLSWFIRDPRHPLMQTLRRLTEPLYGPIRRTLRLEGLSIDPTPLILIVLLMIVQAMLEGLLR